MNIFNARSTNRVIAYPSIADIFLSFSLKKNGLGSIFTLPPRPKISRSFSFSESEAPRRVSNGFARIKGKSEVREAEIGRTQSVYGLQSPGLSWIDSLGSSPGSSPGGPSGPSPSPCPNCSESANELLMLMTDCDISGPPAVVSSCQPISRSHSLASLQPRGGEPLLLLLLQGPQHLHGQHLGQGQVRELQEHQGSRGERWKQLG